MSDLWQQTKDAMPRAKRLGLAGAAFGLLGIGAALLPQIGWVGLDGDMALVLAGWGAVGVGFARVVRPIPEWRGFALFFAGLLLAGVAAVITGHVDLNGLAMLVILGLLAHGILSVLFGLRVSGRLEGWRGVVASGLCALGVGLFMIVGWPDRSVRLVGLLLGVTFLATALALILLAFSLPNGLDAPPRR
ncbi:MAG: hypothetical protein JXJ18_03820 [Rhodobacteraceae bacterium]|nr:hypothetical protein [Paracoccaceae bacterium]